MVAFDRHATEDTPANSRAALTSYAVHCCVPPSCTCGGDAPATQHALVVIVLAPHQTWEEIDRTFFKKLLSLCQDVDHHIRVASCSQLAEVARVAGRDVVAKTILPELFELLNDEEVQVRRGGLLDPWGGGVGGWGGLMEPVGTSTLVRPRRRRGATKSRVGEALLVLMDHVALAGNSSNISIDWHGIPVNTTQAGMRFSNRWPGRLACRPALRR